MTAGHRSRRWMAYAAAAVLAAAVSLPNAAQSAQPSDRTLQRRPVNSETNSATAQARPPQPAPEQTRPWSLDDALPANSPAAQSHETKTAPAAKRSLSKSESNKPELGRLPLGNGAGSFGVETETKVKTTAFPDGRPAPGVESTQRRPPSYFGLSISVPTTDK